MTVHGPYDQAEWNTMLNLRFDVRNLTRLDEKKYKLNIKAEKKLLKSYMTREAA
jgi:hypothetical protein